MDLQPRLIGKNLETRPLLEDDFEGLYFAASDPMIWEQHPDPLRYKREIFKKYFDSGIESKGCLVIVDKQTQEIMGSSRFYDFSSDRKEITVGFTFLKRKYWGGEYNKELKHLMLTHAFNFTETIIFDVGSENFRSRKALEKIGAQLTSQKEKHTPDGRRLVALTYMIKKSDFNGLL